MPSPITLETADSEFFDAIANRVSRLDSILSEHFVYRTMAATLLNKARLIGYLQSNRIRVASPRIIELQIVTTDRTSVHRGTVGMQLFDGESSGMIESDFFHVWVDSGSTWQLIYREVTETPKAIAE